MDSLINMHSTVVTLCEAYCISIVLLTCQWIPEVFASVLLNIGGVQIIIVIMKEEDVTKRKEIIKKIWGFYYACIDFPFAKICYECLPVLQLHYMDIFVHFPFKCKTSKLLFVSCSLWVWVGVVFWYLLCNIQSIEYKEMIWLNIMRNVCPLLHRERK